MTEFEDVIKHAKDANFNLWKTIGDAIVKTGQFDEIVAHHTSAEDNLWKIIGMLLKDVNNLQQKFKELEKDESI